MGELLLSYAQHARDSWVSWWRGADWLPWSSWAALAQGPLHALKQQQQQARRLVGGIFYVDFKAKMRLPDLQSPPGRGLSRSLPRDPGVPWRGGSDLPCWELIPRAQFSFRSGALGFTPHQGGSGLESSLTLGWRARLLLGVWVGVCLLVTERALTSPSPGQQSGRHSFVLGALS